MTSSAEREEEKYEIHCFPPVTCAFRNVGKKPTMIETRAEHLLKSLVQCEKQALSSSEEHDLQRMVFSGTINCH